MNKINYNIFQYLSLVRYRGIELIIKKYKNLKISLILDLEDSAQDLFNSSNTKILKETAREGLNYLANKKINFNNKIYIRINNIKSNEFKKDIATINEVLEKKFPIVGIFLPKTSSYKDINYTFKKLNNKKIKIVPIIESKIGLNNLEKILEEDKQNIISHVHYGHFDFCLDQNIWPFPEPYHYEFWRIVGPIIKLTENFKKKFIQTPFPLIKNSEIYWSMIKYMNESCKIKKIYTSLVNYDHNFIIKPDKIQNLRIKKISTNNQFKINFAKKIYNEYLSFKSKNKSFSLSKKRFIAPHQFLMAKKFLNKEKIL